MKKKVTFFDWILGRDRTLPTSEELAAHAHYYFSCHHHGGNRVEVIEIVNDYQYTIIRTAIERKTQS
jgi:hypothetical protein